MKDLTRLNRDYRLRDAIVIALATALFFLAVLGIYAKVNELGDLGHSMYDSYTLQAMAWRRGEVRLDKNYPWLELAIINDEYLSEHDRSDNEAYIAFYGDSNVNPIEHEDDKYYVSFPPVPSVPMFFLSFIFGENTPSGLMSVLYTVLAFLFAALTANRIGLNGFESAGIAAVGIFTSSALFLACNRIVGGVWFQAQTMSLMLTMMAFWFIQGKKESDMYWSFAMLALAVGARPFQILYFFYLAYAAWKFKGKKILKTWKYYIAPAAIGCVYMIYNIVRFGDPLEFGHNYLPEFMRVPDGQFGVRYFAENFKTAVLLLPKMADGKIEYPSFGFAFYVSNVIFVALVVVIIGLIVKFFVEKSVKNAEKDTDGLIRMGILFVLMTAHLVCLMLHKTWGAWQFGSRYVVDLIPAAVVTLSIGVKRIKSINGKNIIFNRFVRIAALILIAEIFIIGLKINIEGCIGLF